MCGSEPGIYQSDQQQVGLININEFDMGKLNHALRYA